MSDGFVFLGPDRKITFANVRFSRKLSLPYRSILNKQFAKYVFRQDREAFVSFLDRIEESRIGIHETRMVNRTGRIIHVMVTCRRFDMERDTPATLLVITDITDKRLAEERARMLATLVDCAKFEAILVHNEGNQIIYSNKAAEEMFGYLPSRLMGTSLDTLFRRDEENDRITLVSTEPGDAAYELTGIQSNGSVFPVEVSESTDKGDDGSSLGLIFARDITKRRRAETELLLANEQLKAMNEELIFVREAQQRFFANMSHELKTPLNTISGYAGLMLEGVGGTLSEKHLKWAESIKRQSNQLLVIIQEILEFAKAGRQETDVSLKPVRTDAVVQEIAAAAAALVGKKPVEILTRLPSPPPTITTDPHRLRRVLTNLMSNAVKFTDRGSVTIGIEPLEESSFGFFVEDTGIGIPESEISRIFNDFYQVSRPGADNISGSGLGLAIVRRLVEQLGGAVHVESAPDKGSRFTVVLPAKLSKSGQKITGRPSDPAEAPQSSAPTTV
jgi:PAS domain S-box-containing protein